MDQVNKPMQYYVKYYQKSDNYKNLNENTRIVFDSLFSAFFQNGILDWSNKYIAHILNVHYKSVSRYITQLTNAGLIWHSNTKMKDENERWSENRIMWLDESFFPEIAKKSKYQREHPVNESDFVKSEDVVPAAAGVVPEDDPSDIGKDVQNALLYAIQKNSKK